MNYADFAAFSRAWLSSDPNDPSLPNDPNLIDPNDFNGWNQKLNLVTTGDSAYCIDLADLVEFMDNGYWLWTACWKASMEMEMVMMMSGGEGMTQMGLLPMEPLAVESVYADSTVIPADVIPAQTVIPAQAGIQSDAATDAENITQVLGFLNTLLEADSPENEQAILEIMAVLEQWLAEIP